jgi:hypothetical protein
MEEEGKILSVNDDGESGEVERTSDNADFWFVIPEGASIDVSVGDLVSIIITPAGEEKQAVVVNSNPPDS